MRRLIVPQHLTLLAFLIIVAVGITKGETNMRGEQDLSCIGEISGISGPPPGTARCLQEEEKMAERITCTDCGCAITPATAQDFGGRCQDCSETSYQDMARQAALWREHGWRAEVSLVVEHIIDTAWQETKSRLLREVWEEKDGRGVNGIHHLARAFVRAARENGLQLSVLVALVMQETQQSPFNNTLVGKAGERTMVQINPLDGNTDRAAAIKAGLRNPGEAIGWAGSMLRRTYHDIDPFHGLARYNGGFGGMNTKAAQKYALGVMARMEELEDADSLWGIVPE